MQLAYAAENLTPIPAGHFLARKAREPDAIKAALKSDPAAVVRNILEGFDGKATLAQISEMLVGDLFTEAEWKRWWTSAKKAMKPAVTFRSRQRNRSRSHCGASRSHARTSS